MKKIILILIPLLTINLCSAQISGTDSRVSFGLYQDVKLATIKDNYGNTPFTTDVRFEFMMEGESHGSGSGLIGLTFEYADLSDVSFVRFGIQGGYNFRNYRLLFGLGYFDNAIYIGAGAIIRDIANNNQGNMSIELTDDFTIFLTKWLSLNLKSTLMQRGDLAYMYGDISGSYRPWEWRINLYAGVKMYINR